MWIGFQLNDPASPIYNWREGKIKEVLSNFRAQECQATKRTYYPLFVFDTGDAGIERAKRLIPLCRSHSILMVGEPGEGKTPYIEIIAHAIADYHADQLGDRSLAAVRSAPDLDFFRSEEGTVTCPCLFDDGDLFDQRPRTLKAYFDVSQFESMTRERWGATKLVRGQARLAAENMYDLAAVPTDEDWVIACGARNPVENRNAIFFDMVKKTFPETMSRTNAVAILKRSSVVLNTTSEIFERLAGLDSDVTRSTKTGHYITKEAGDILYAYIEHGVERNKEDYNNLRDRQLRFVTALLRKDAVPRPPSSVPIKQEPEKDGVEEGRPKRSRGEDPGPSQLPARVTWARSFGSFPEPGLCIDLSSPTRPMHSAAAAVDATDVRLESAVPADNAPGWSAEQQFALAHDLNLALDLDSSD